MKKTCYIAHGKLAYYQKVEAVIVFFKHWLLLLKKFDNKIVVFNL